MSCTLCGYDTGWHGHDGIPAGRRGALRTVHFAALDLSYRRADKQPAAVQEVWTAHYPTWDGLHHSSGADGRILPVAVDYTGLITAADVAATYGLASTDSGSKWTRRAGLHAVGTRLGDGAKLYRATDVQAARAAMPGPGVGGGRPRTATPPDRAVRVRLGDLLPAVDAHAAAAGIDRDDAIRALIAAGLGRAR